MNPEIWAYMNRYADFHAPHLLEQYVANTPHEGLAKYEKAGDFAYAVGKTARAVQIGMAISAIDGPIPIADAVGLGVASALALKAWYEFLVD